MPVVKISSGGQVRIPKEIMEKLNISSGDYLDFEFYEGKVIITAKKLVDVDQLWFWSKEWQKEEEEAEEDVKAQRLSPIFSTGEEGVAYLRERRKELLKNHKKPPRKTSK